MKTCHHVSEFWSSVQGVRAGMCSGDVPFFWGGVRGLAFLLWVALVTVGSLKAMTTKAPK